MRSTIAGTVYDTDTAELIGEYEDYSESMYINFGLYRRVKAKDYFLAGEGGPLTRFSGRERIVRLTDAEAKSIIKEYFEIETF